MKASRVFSFFDG